MEKKEFSQLTKEDFLKVITDKRNLRKAEQYHRSESFNEDGSDTDYEEENVPENVPVVD